MRMPEPRLQRACSCQGACPECQEQQLDQEHVGLRAKSLGSDMLEQPAMIPGTVEEILRSPGQPLDPGVRDFMEPRFGHDFSQVRVHTDLKASESARALDAFAYTVGRNMVFGARQDQPSTVEGRKLLAHELSHTIQQGATVRRLTRHSPQTKAPAMHGTQPTIQRAMALNSRFMTTP